MSGYFKRMAQLARSTLAQPSLIQTSLPKAPSQPADPVIQKPMPLPQSDMQQPIKHPQPEARKIVAPMQKVSGKATSTATATATTPPQAIDGDGAGKEALPVSEQTISLPQLPPSITYSTKAEKQISSAPPPPSAWQVTRVRDEPLLPRASLRKAEQPAAAPPAPARKPENQANPPALQRMEIPAPDPVAKKIADTGQNSVAPSTQTGSHTIRPEAINAPAHHPAPPGQSEAAHPLEVNAMATIAQPPAHLLAPGKPPSFEINIGAISVELAPEREAPALMETPARRSAPIRQHTGIWSGTRDLTRNYIRGI